MNFIERLDFSAELDKMTTDLNNFVDVNPWPDTTYMLNDKKYHANQLGLTYRPNCENPLGDAGGSLIDPVTRTLIGKESDFTEWNNVGDYTRQIISKLSEFTGEQFGRIRYMRLMPKTGLSVHADFETRYHYVFKTNKYAYFGESLENNELAAKCYHIPSDGFFYKVDTTKEHFVFNGGWEPRIHLVICSSWDHPN
jgi:hypothetical protein